MKKKDKKYQTRTLKKVLKYIQAYRIFLALSLAFAVVNVAAVLYIPVLTGRTIDHILAAGQVEFTVITKLLWQIGIVAVLAAFAQWLMNVCNNKITYEVVQDVRREAFAKIEILPLKFIDSHSHGELVSRVIADVDQFADGLLMGFSQLFTGVITILGTLLFMVSINLKITLVVVLVTPVSLFVAAFIARRTFSMFMLQSTTRGEQTSLINEMIENQKVVQAFSKEKDVLEKFDEINERLEQASLKATFFSSLTNPGTRFVNSLVYTGVALVGALFAMAGSGAFTVGQLSCFLSYANQYTKPFNEISGVVTELQNALACAARIFALIEEESQTPEPEGAVTLKDVEGRVELSHVDFSYVPDKPVLKDFDLHVKSGQRIAIVGATGSGKTTVVNLLTRFYDVDKGNILLDGVNIQDIPKDELRGNIAIVLQDTVLFSDTIAGNIRYGKLDADDNAVKRAAQTANADIFIERLPDGYNSVLSESGGNLSQGQRQLLSIARAVLADPSILILDEATSSVDTRTELHIQEAMLALMKNRTSLIIAHRLSTIRTADKIIVVDDGKIVESGNHAELLKQEGVYYRLYQNQFAGLQT